MSLKSEKATVGEGDLPLQEPSFRINVTHLEGPPFNDALPDFCFGVVFPLL